MQLSLTLPDAPEIKTHEIENNSESQAHINANRGKFNKKCKEVYALLDSGIELTVLSAIVDYGISSLPRRILDLKENGLVVSDKWASEKRYKIWFLSEQDKLVNRKTL